MNRTKYTEGLVVDILCCRYFDYIQHIIIPNCMMTCMEADLLSVSNDRYIHEIEVKCSRQDFMNEFAPSNERSRTKLSHAKLRKRSIINGTHNGTHLIARYSVAFPPELEDLAKRYVPSNCGLIRVTAGECGDELNGNISILRNPKRLFNSRQLNESEYIKIAKIVCARYWNQRLYGKNGRK